MSKQTATASTALTVTRLTQMMKGVLEPFFPKVQVVGEVSNFSVSKFGHCYFTLKDRSAQLNCVLWQSGYSKLRFTMKDGMEVVCDGKVEFYIPQGKAQLIVSSVNPQGTGTLEMEFRRLQEKLTKEGLFSTARKKEIPDKIRTIGVITSRTGAAIHDFLNILYSRTRRIRTIVVPVLVQGLGAAQEIANAFDQLNQLTGVDRPDVIALIRGGGSTEDLWTFNEEVAVRAVANSEIPVVTGIGHEIDNSLCDYAADLRTFTPSEAAVRLASDDRDLFYSLQLLKKRLNLSIRNQLSQFSLRLDRSRRELILRDPKTRLVESKLKKVHEARDRLNRAIIRCLEKREARTAKCSARLDALSPLAVLSRGYSLTQKLTTGEIVHQAWETAPGDKVLTLLGEGSIECRVERVNLWRD